MQKPFDFGATLKNLRKQRGYTQKRLAAVLDLSETTISKYESNIAVPPFETIRAIAAWFNVSIDVLAGNEPPNTVSLDGLDQQQIETIQALVKSYSAKNHNISSEQQDYELLGHVADCLIRHNR